MRLGSVTIDSGSGLGAEVAVPSVEIECTDAVFAADTLELYSSFDPIGGVVSHGLIVVLCSEGRAHHGGLSKVICGAPSAGRERKPRSKTAIEQIRHLLDLIRRAALLLSQPTPLTTWPCHERFPRW